ncbi:MAG: adaptor protein MecA, partial [Streptococcaceae bacterium]|nr:adaptor protein MecA [Streptococcaceae bacterium]
MELERVNENTVKVFVFPEDLEEREVNFVEMMSDQSKVEEFFFSIIDEAGIKDEFENSEVISFQVVPKRDSIEIII